MYWWDSIYWSGCLVVGVFTFENFSSCAFEICRVFCICYCYMWDFILPYLQANKLSCFIDAGGRIRLLGPKQETQLLSRQQASWTLFAYNLRVSLMTGTTQMGVKHWAWRTYQFVASIKQAHSLSHERHYLIPQGCVLQTQPWEMAQVKNGQGLPFLA